MGALKPFEDGNGRERYRCSIFVSPALRVGHTTIAPPIARANQPWARYHCLLLRASKEETPLAWRQITDWGKQNARVLRLADRLGRGRSRLRLLDRFGTPLRPIRPDLSRWADETLAAIWIGHATILLRLGSKTILTDPVFSSRIGLDFGLVTGGPGRLIAPALSIRELPPIDLVLLSHAHFDHLDRPSLDQLPKSTPILTAVNTAELIHDLGFRSVTEMRWGQTFRLDDLKVTAWQVEHWGARTFTDWHRGFNAYLLEAGRRRVLFGGDTAFCDHFRAIGKLDLAILGIGAYDPYIAAHATPEQALQMADNLHADFMLPMHHSTFRLSHEPMDEPMIRLLTAAESNNDRIIIREVGRQWALAS